MTDTTHAHPNGAPVTEVARDELRRGDLVTLTHEESGVSVTGPFVDWSSKGPNVIALQIYADDDPSTFFLSSWAFRFVSATREVPEHAPGTTGWATVEGKRRRGFTVDEKGFVYAIPSQIGTGYRAASASEWSDFVPDQDTAALRAEVERLAQEKAEVIANANILEGQRRREIEHKAEILRDRDGHRRRADAAEARVARVNGPAVSEVLAGDGKIEHIVQAVVALAHGPLVAADEQAAEGEAAKVPGYDRAAELIRFHLQGSEISASDRDELEAFADHLDAKPVAGPDSDAPSALPTREQIAEALHDDRLPDGEPRLGKAHRLIVADAVLALLTGSASNYQP